MKYDSSLVTILWKGMHVTGKKKGTFVSVNKDEDSISVEANADGEAVFSRTGANTGTATVTLDQTSPFCKILNQAAKTFDPSEFWVVDPSTKERRGGVECYISKVADGEWGDNSGSRAYTIKIGNLQIIND